MLSITRSAVISLLTFIALQTQAVNTSHWLHTSEADFKKGTFHNVVATNLGDLKLSRAVKMILEQDPHVSAVYSLAEAPDGAIYAGTGPRGVLLRIKDNKSTEVYHPEGMSNIFALAIDDKGRVLMGTGGEKGKILRIANPNDKDPKAKKIFTADDVKYVWAIAQTPDGNLYAATGPNGQIFEIKPDGSKSVLLDSDENNILSMISDGKDTLYAGTDPNGLVYRINRKTKEVFVLYDAAESEISALALDAKGNLYAATAEASEKPPAAPGAEDGAKEKSGRPEGAGNLPLPAQPPENPKPPGEPKPNPGEPNPIPKAINYRPSPFDAFPPSPGTPGEGRREGQAFLTTNSSTCRNTWQKVSQLADDPADDPTNPTPAPTPTPKPGHKPSTPPAQPQNPALPAPPEPVDFGKPKAEGNAIYKIDSEGFVREIFRQPVMVLSLAERNGVLLVGTGGEGLIYQIDPAAEETSVLARVDPKQVLSMFVAKEGQIYLGLANVGAVATMSSGFATEGTFTSPVLDATQISRFGKIHLQGSLPKDTTLTLATRSGNVQDPEKTGWSNWTDEVPATSFVQVKSPSARFMQYRLSFGTTSGSATASVDEIEVAYQMPNLAPVVKSIKIGSGAGADKLGGLLNGGLEALTPATPKPATKTTVESITWEAEDANADAMVYSLYFRNGSKAPWILLKDKLTENHYDWETRNVADGRYEIKIIASDEAANVPGQGRATSRVSDPILIDNTPPLVGDIKADAKGATARIQAKIVDKTSTVASVDYSIDSGNDWQAVLPSDNIFDGPEETIDFSIPKLTVGQHQITLRAADAKGNHAYETVFVNIEAQAGK